MTDHMIKVLWFSGTQINTDSSFFYETWLSSMAKLLIESKSVVLYNVTLGNVESAVANLDTELSEWVLPAKIFKNSGSITDSGISTIQEIISFVNPDVVHIWGMEKPWGLLTSTGILGDCVLLEIQGIKSTCGDVYYGGLDFKDVLSTLAIQEIIFPNRSLFSIRKQFEHWGKQERKMIESHNYIGAQSNWVRSYVKLLNSEAVIYDSKIALRKEFMNPNSWEIRKDSDEVILMTSSSFAVPYKGIHLLLNVVDLLKNKYPKIRLKIAGEWNVSSRFYRKSGYLKWFVSRAKSLGVYDSLEFLGPLNATELIDHFYSSDVYIIPSFVESYSLALAEAMTVGIPSVVSYVGGMIELADDDQSALFFPAGDYYACASKIDQIISDNTLANKLSEVSRKAAYGRNDPSRVVRKQLEIYNKILNS